MHSFISRRAFTLSLGRSLLPILPLVLGWLGSCAVALAADQTILHTFTGAPSDGGAPYANLIQGDDGNFYGTTTTGGANDQGTVFKISPFGTVTILHSFSFSTEGNGANYGLAWAN